MESFHWGTCPSGSIRTSCCFWKVKAVSAIWSLLRAQEEMPMPPDEKVPSERHRCGLIQQLEERWYLKRYVRSSSWLLHILPGG